jgi:hypothetical protein
MNTLTRRMFIGGLAASAVVVGRARDANASATTDIQGMLDRRGKVELPPGLFDVADLIVRSGTTVTGNGTVLRASGAGACALIVDSQAEDVVLDRVTLDGNRVLFPDGDGCALYAPGGTVDLRMYQVTARGGQAFTVFLDTVDGGHLRTRVQDCAFSDAGYGWDTFGSGGLHDAKLSYCAFFGSSGQGFATTNSSGLRMRHIVVAGPIGNGISLEPASDADLAYLWVQDLGPDSVGVWVRPSGHAPGVVASNIVLRHASFFGRMSQAVILDSVEGHALCDIQHPGLAVVIK